MSSQCHVLMIMISLRVTSTVSMSAAAVAIAAAAIIAFERVEKFIDRSNNQLRTVAVNVPVHERNSGDQKSMLTCLQNTI